LVPEPVEGAVSHSKKNSFSNLNPLFILILIVILILKKVPKNRLEIFLERETQ
jgi:hypothetical protein